MTKPKTKTRNHKKPDKEDPSTAGPQSWTPLLAAFREAFDWALDVAHHLARDYPEEVETVERVRTYMRKRIAGEPASIRIDDVMFTFALIITAIERDLGPVKHLGPWFATPIRLPSADELARGTTPHPLVWSLAITPRIAA